MELKDLTALGITEEQANKVLEQHTAELTAEQQKYTDLNAELETAKGTISELTDKVKAFDGEDIEGLKKAESDWESKYNADIAALKLDKALELSLAGAKARDVDIVKSQLDSSLLKLDDDGKITGLTEQLDKLKADKAFLFADGDEPTARIDTGLDHGSATETTSDAQARAVMGLPATK
ncbi:phage scaffolding protein [Ruminococcus sp.]|jgi:chromosome segregation ATPase|uniref:phage scaffolding protein n=1 Tax=Ruminococcus sp. TaxID=41978 RepID=UPI00259B3C57|nr:phage scaffolding protein [uncultured Ruminococcus sp.]